MNFNPNNNAKFENYDFANILQNIQYNMSKKTKKESDEEWKKLEQREMNEERHQLDLKKGYEEDEEYEESED